MVTLAQLNAMDQARFVAVCGGAFEHSPWVAERAWEGRPFATIQELHARMAAVVMEAGMAAKVALIQAHPDLVGKLAKEGRLTAESTSEQKAAGLGELSAQEAAALERYNAAYRERFGFPFVICARENKKAAILAAFAERMGHTREEEIGAALCEIGRIARLRLGELVIGNW